MQKASTKTGLRVNVYILDKVYLTGRKVAADFKHNMKVIFDDVLPKLNYTVLSGVDPIAEVIWFAILNRSSKPDQIYASKKRCIWTVDRGLPRPPF